MAQAPSKKVLLALTPAMLDQVNFVAETEHRTRSDLMREALRRYLESFQTKRSALGLTRQPLVDPSTTVEPFIQREPVYAPQTPPWSR